MKRSAFSLVELSIVLVILGLLTGGILSGQSLIRASELRAVTSEYSRYSTAVQSFRDKYFSLPGDMSNAQSFWTADANCAAGYAGTTVPTGTCNGDGEGHIIAPAAASKTGEIFQFWKQMALAGMIEGTYTGYSGTGGAIHMISGQNVPKSKISGGMWGLREYVNNYTGNAVYFDGSYGNYLQMGGGTTGADNSSPILKPEEMWNLDTKLDDGKPATGKIVAFPFASASNCTDAGAGATGSSNMSANYLLSWGSASCVFVARSQFN